jgi:hypothetical protein
MTKLCVIIISFSGMTKLLVGLGSTKQGTVSIEIIDLESPSKTCQNLPRFPLALEGPFGGLGFLDKPVICGGTDRHSETTDDCYSLEGNQWTYSSSLNTERYGAAVSPSLYPSQSHKFFVTGGFDDLGHQLNTVEVLTEKGWEAMWTQMEQKLKLGRSDHVAFLVPDNIVDCSNN